MVKRSSEVTHHFRIESLIKTVVWGHSTCVCYGHKIMRVLGVFKARKKYFAEKMEKCPTGEVLAYVGTMAPGP